MSTLRTDTLQTTDSSFTIPVNQLASKSNLIPLQLTVSNLAALKAVSTSSVVGIQTLGYFNKGDGGAGLYFVPASFVGLVGNDCDIIQANDGGFFQLNHNNSIDIRQAGAVHNTDCTSAINKAIAAVSAAANLNRGGKVIIPPIWANFTGTILVSSPFITVTGLTAGPAALLRSLTPDVTAFKTTGNYTTLSHVEVTYATGATAAAGIEISAANFNSTGLVVSGAFNGIYFRQGSAHVIRDIRLLDCVNTGFLFQGDSGFINDVLIDDWFCGNNDNTKFTLGHFRVVGRLEALMLGKGDGIGGRRAFTCDALGGLGLRYSTFNSCFWDSTDFGAVFDGGGYNTFVNCWASNGRTTGQAGMSMINSTHFSITNGNFFNSGTQGLNIDGCTDFTISATDTSNNSVDIDGADAGLRINNSSRFTVTASGGQGVRQFFGVLIDSSSDFSVLGNRFGPNKNGPIVIGSGCTNFEVSGNRGYTSRNRGSSTLVATTTSLVVNHGLSRTPLLSGISLQQNGSTTAPLYVSAVTPTTFTVTTSASNAGAAPFTWEASAEQAP